MTDSIDTSDVETSVGVVRGVRRQDGAAYLGIPFAEPPVDALRFAEPVAHHRWSGVRDATRFGPTPPQARTSFSSRMPEPAFPGQSFLVLNVFAAATSRELRPVLVFVHGGGFIGGSASSPWYDGGRFNRDGVITVSVSYRLGFDGFGWVGDAANNRAVRDVIAALDWVRLNISRFGGDPQRVTLVGQSAGAVITYGVLASEAARGLVQQAWALSGRPRVMPVEDAAQLSEIVADLAGVDATVEGFTAVPPTEMIRFQAEAVRLLNGDRTELETLRSLGTGTMRFGPIVDGQLIRSPIDEALTTGPMAGVPLVLATTDNEFNDFVDGHEAAIRAVGRNEILKTMGVSQDVAREYSAAHAGLDDVGLVAQWITDNRYRAPTLALADKRRESNLPTWLYRFSWAPAEDGRSLHCLDVPFFFDRLDADQVEQLAGTTPPQILADRLHASAVAFARSSDPGWPDYSRRGITARFDRTFTLEADGYHDVRLLHKN